MNGLLLFGGALVSAYAIAALSMRTGRPDLDRHIPRLAAEAMLAFPGQAVTDPRIPRILMAIVRMESAGARPPVIGDAGHSTGPAIGPMQVTRGTAKALGLWLPPAGLTDVQERDAFALIAQDEALCLRWGVAVYRDKLRAAAGNVWEAARRYNGSGPAAESYRQKLQDFYAQTWGPFTPGTGAPTA